MSTTSGSEWVALAKTLSKEFAERAAEHDANDSFVAENYARLAEAKLFTFAIPSELGGGGASYPEVAAVLQELARGCGSTALTLSMHTHILAMNIFKHKHGAPGEAMLRKVAANNLQLVSTGAGDWLSSSGTMTKVEGGFRLSGAKAFCSGAPGSKVLVTSAQYDDPNEGPQVLHFAVPLSSEGVKIKDTWRAMGMRGTGSTEVALDNVMVPEEAVVLRRPRGQWHKVWDLVLPNALPLIMAVYRGIAEAAVDLVVSECKSKDHRKSDETTAYLVGEMQNELTTAQLAHDAMVALNGDYGFAPGFETSNAMLVRKTIVAKSTLAAVEKGLETMGGAGFMRSQPLERMLRDLHAGQFHPLSERRQTRFTGRYLLGLTPEG